MLALTILSYLYSLTVQATGAEFIFPPLIGRSSFIDYFVWKPGQYRHFFCNCLELYFFSFKVPPQVRAFDFNCFFNTTCHTKLCLLLVLFEEDLPPPLCPWNAHQNQIFQADANLTNFALKVQKFTAKIGPSLLVKGFLARLKLTQIWDCKM